MFYHTIYPSPLGDLTLLADDQALYGLWFSDQQHYGANYDLGRSKGQVTPLLIRVTTWLDAYFAGHQPDPATLPLKPEVTAFRQQVLSVIRQVPYGQTITYQEIATRMGRPTASRAVGGAVGHNPISIIIPCHRVMGSDGSLTGYAGGIDRKIALLTLEGCDLAALRADRAN